MKVELAKPFEREIKPKVEKEKKHTFRASPIKPVFYEDTDRTMFESLRQLRMQIAQKENIPPYIVFTDDSLNDMVDKKPLTMEAFSEIRGVGQIKQRRFGKVFVSLIRYLMDLPPLK
jgi:ATP-dependent DNA helicase RecQ